MDDEDMGYRDDPRFYSQHVRIPGPPVTPKIPLFPVVPAVRTHSDNEPTPWSGGQEGVDKSMDGPFGVSLFDGSFEDSAKAQKRKAKRKNSVVSLGSDSTATEAEVAGYWKGDPGLRGGAYVRSWLFPIRRGLSTYYFLMSFVLIFCFAIKACLELSFTVVTPLLQHVDLGTVVTTMCSFLLLLLVTATLASSNWVLLNSCWAGRELLELKRFECSGQLRYSSPGCDSWDYMSQALYHLGLELFPLVFGLFKGLQQSDLRCIIGYWLFSAMLVAFGLVCIFSLLTLSRYSWYFFCEVGIEDSLTWWRAARARRKAGIPLDTPIPLLPSSPLPRHPSYSLSVAGEQKTPARDDDEGSDEYLRPVKEGSASSDDEAIPEVDLLLRRPKFKPLPPSAERTRIFSEQSYSEDTTTTVDSRMSFQRVSDSRRPTVTRAPESAQRTPEAGAITQCWYAVSDALACFRRCYFAEDTSPGDRYIKPVPLMIMHRYYPNVPDRESGLEFVLPPLAEVVETPVAKKSKGCCCRRRRMPASPSSGDFLDGVASSPMLTETDDSVASSKVSRRRRSYVMIEQRNVAYWCFQSCHLSLGSFMAAVAFNAFATVTLIAAFQLSYMDAALVGIVCGLMGWGLIVLVTYLRRKRHKTEKKPVPSRGPVELGGDASYAPMNPPLSPGPFNRGLPEPQRPDIITSPRTRSQSTAVSSMLSRWLKVFYLGSPLYRNVVATLSALALLFVITALGLALGRDDVAAQYLLGATAVVVLFMCITLMCATPSGAATQVFKTVVPVTCGVTLLITVVVSVLCDHCSWVIYPALLFVITVGVLILARLQLLASEVPVPESGIVAHAVAFPELMEPAMQRAADKAKRKRKDLNLPRYLCGRVSACVVFVLTLMMCGIAGVNHGFAPQFQTVPLHTPLTLRNASDTPYPICAQSWGAGASESTNSLSPVDVSLFAGLAYATGDALVSDFVSFFDTSEWAHAWQIMPPPLPYDQNSTLFYEFYNELFGISVIAVRGISVNGAAIKDFELWIEATVLQCTLFLLPGFNYVPQPVITSLIQSMGWLENVFTVSTPLWTPIVDYITDVVEKRSSPCEVVIIGHSLGGGIAKIVGALSGHTAVSIAGPGLFVTKSKLGLDPAAVQAFSVNIVPEGDPIASMDRLEGLIQLIDCKSSNYVDCHDIHRTTMELIRSCGDSNGRGVSVTLKT